MAFDFSITTRAPSSLALPFDESRYAASMELWNSLFAMDAGDTHDEGANMLDPPSPLKSAASAAATATKTKAEQNIPRTSLKRPATKKSFAPTTVMASAGQDGLKHKRRYCKEPGCERIVKSQGLCQRHGAKPRKCRIECCTKQAQGNFDGMCKSHFKSHSGVTTMPCPSSSTLQTDQNGYRLAPPSASPLPPRPVQPPVGSSVYDRIIPESLLWVASSGTLMPIVTHLKQGFDLAKLPAWHRNEERKARGLLPVQPTTDLEAWERELVMTELLLLTGSAPSPVVGQLLARGWGCTLDFHKDLAVLVCQNRGNVSGSMNTEATLGDEEDSQENAAPMDRTLENEKDRRMGEPTSSQMLNQPHHRAQISLQDQEQFMSFRSSSTPSGSADAMIATMNTLTAGALSTTNDRNDHNSHIALGYDNGKVGSEDSNESLEADIMNLAGGCNSDFDLSVDPVAASWSVPSLPSSLQQQQQQNVRLQPMLDQKWQQQQQQQQQQQRTQFCRVIQQQDSSGDVVDDFSKEDDLILQYYSSSNDGGGVSTRATGLEFF